LHHSMTEQQREILEKFYLDERNHYRYIARAFKQMGFDSAKLIKAQANTETELLERFFYSCASRSVLEFATAIIAPEVDEVTDAIVIGQQPQGLYERMVEAHNIDSSIIKAFKNHEHDHSEGAHAS